MPPEETRPNEEVTPDEIAELLSFGPSEEEEEEKEGEEEEEVETEEEEEVEGEESEEEEVEEAEEEAEEEEREGEEEEAEEEEAEEEEEEEEETTPAERAELFNQIAELRAQLEEVTAKGKKGKKDAEEAPAEPTFDFEDFLESDEAYESALQSRESFNQILVEVARKASLAAVKAAVQQVSPMISARVAEQVTNQQLVQDFFRANPELIPARRFVATLFTQIQASNPDKDYADLLELTAKEAKSQMGMVGTKSGGKKVKGRKKVSVPPSRRGSPRRGEKPRKPQGIADEIAELANLR